MLSKGRGGDYESSPEQAIASRDGEVVRCCPKEKQLVGCRGYSIYVVIVYSYYLIMIGY